MSGRHINWLRGGVSGVTVLALAISALTLGSASAQAAEEPIPFSASEEDSNGTEAPSTAPQEQSEETAAVPAEDTIQPTAPDALLTAPLAADVPAGMIDLSVMDSKLRGCIIPAANARFNLGLAASATVVPETVLDLTSLNCNSKSIDHIAGIDAFTKLSILDLSVNNISDVTPLAGMSALTQLRLNGNRVLDASSLHSVAALPAMTVFRLDGQKPTHIQLSADAAYANPVRFLTGGLVVPPSDNAGYVNGEYQFGARGVYDRVWNTSFPFGTMKGGMFSGSLQFIVSSGMHDLSAMDSRLRACIVAAGNSQFKLGLAPDTAEVPDIVLELTNLACGSKGIESIAGLEAFTKLSIVDLSTNNISDITPLAEMTELTQLRLQSNLIVNASSLTAVATLPALTVLRLDAQKLTRHLLSVSTAWTNPVMSVDATAVAPTVTDGYANDTYVFADRGLYDRAWETTFAFGAGKTGAFSGTLQLAVSSGMVDLTGMDPHLRACIAAAVGASGESRMLPDSVLQLRELTCEGKQVKHLIGLDRLTRLTRISLGNNEIRDISVIARMPHLEDFQLIGNSVSDISPLKDHPALTAIGLRYNNVKDLTPLAGLTNLITLNLSFNPRVEDLSPLADLTNLQFLSLEYASVQDISPLADLLDLRYLRLSGNRVTDLSPAAGLASLVELSAPYQRVFVSAMPGEAVANPVTNLDGSKVVPGETAGYDPAEHTFTFDDAGIEQRTWSTRFSVGAVRNSLFSGKLQAVVDDGATVDLTDLDPGLVRCIQRETGFTGSAVDAPAAILGIQELACEGMGIRSIDGIERFTSVKSLKLRLNEIVDASPLSRIAGLTGSDLREQLIRLPDSSTGETIANPIRGFDGTPILFADPEYDRTSNTFTFGSEGDRAKGWNTSLSASGSPGGTFTGILIMTAIDASNPVIPIADDRELLVEDQGCVRSIQESVVRGSTAQFKVDCAYDGELVTGFIYSSPTNIGRAVVAGGTVQYTIPATAEVRVHKVAIYSANGTLLGWTSLRVTAENSPSSAGGAGSAPGVTLSATGAAPSTGALAVALLLMLAGCVVMAHRRSRV